MSLYDIAGLDGPAPVAKPSKKSKKTPSQQPKEWTPSPAVAMAPPVLSKKAHQQPPRQAGQAARKAPGAVGSGGLSGGGACASAAGGAAPTPSVTSTLWKDVKQPYDPARPNDYDEWLREEEAKRKEKEIGEALERKREEVEAATGWRKEKAEGDLQTAQAPLNDLAGVSLNDTLADALDYLEGEGTILQSPTSGIIHLNPAWLAETVKPLADHRLQEGSDFIGELAATMAGQGLCDHDTAVDELSLFVANAQASKTLLRALLTLEHAPTGHVNVLERYGITIDKLNELLAAHACRVAVEAAGRVSVVVGPPVSGDRAQHGVVARVGGHCAREEGKRKGQAHSASRRGDALLWNMRVS